MTLIPADELDAMAAKGTLRLAEAARAELDTLNVQTHETPAQEATLMEASFSASTRSLSG